MKYEVTVYEDHKRRVSEKKYVIKMIPQMSNNSNLTVVTLTRHFSVDRKCSLLPGGMLDRKRPGNLIMAVPDVRYLRNTSTTEKLQHESLQ